MDELLYAGYEISGSYKAKKYRVTQYIASGQEILADTIISGEHIPIIPCYGEHAIVEGEEQWEGITRLAKDPSRLRNFALSYLGDITSRSPEKSQYSFKNRLPDMKICIQSLELIIIMLMCFKIGQLRMVKSFL